MSYLFNKLKIRSVELKNRIAMSPMCMYSSDDGFANDWHLTHIGTRAVGGVALAIMEATAVTPEGRITPYDLGLWKDEHIEYLKKITSFVEKQNCVAGIQLAHAGRKASRTRPWQGGHGLSIKEGAWQTVAPSAVPFTKGDLVPKELEEGEIDNLVNAFKASAHRALLAGFKVIEIHGAHGYLINEFLSPISNKRKDKYGGSFDNRIRFLIDIVEAIREVWPEHLPLFLRISSSDWVEGGWTIDDSIALANIVKAKGVDLIDCSSGGNASHAKIQVGPGYQVPFAEKIKRETGIMTGAVGMITTANQAEQIIATGQGDIVLLARELLRNPYFALQAAKDLNYEILWPSQYERAKLK